MSVNIASALFSALKVATKETSLTPGDVRSEGVEKATRELLRVSFNAAIPGRMLTISRDSYSALINMSAILQHKPWDDFAGRLATTSRSKKLMI